MFYETQLRLLRDTFRKCRIQTAIVDPDAPHQNQSQSSFDTTPASLVRRLVPDIAPATVYRLRDALHCQYVCLALPELPGNALLIIGPYLSVPPTPRQIMEWAEGKDISPRKQRHLEEYYASLPLLQDSSHLFILLDAFCEQLWGIGNYNVEYLDGDSLVPLPLLTKVASEQDKETEDPLLQMKNIELRYSYEKEMMDAVSKGQIHKADLLFSNISTFFFEQRSADPVRNAKNYCIIMNTLLRKAAQQGNVHPMYLDSVSSAYAVKIEQLLTLEELQPLMSDMFRNYCRLVRKYSTQKHTPPVQQALIYIDANLTGDLSLNTLAQKLNISNSYLSTIFKKETGQTLTDLIAQRRVDRAKELLRTTRLQIQTVAQHCGIVDVHYFSKIFKKVTGQTPKEYRETLKR